MSDFTHLHECIGPDAGVMPILQYGAEIWGFGKYSPPDKIHHRAMRFLLGVHRFTPVPASYGDTGWLKPRKKQISVFI